MNMNMHGLLRVVGRLEGGARGGAPLRLMGSTLARCTLVSAIALPLAGAVAHATAAAGAGGGSGLIAVCYGKSGVPRIVTSSPARCSKGERSLSWNQQGPRGLDGAAGPQGPKGDTGAAGLPGAKGDTGAAGAIGPAGSAGAIGPSGPAGAVGPTGPQGAKGAIGNTGATGPSGPSGPSGPQGPAGPQGTTGAPGLSAVEYVTGSSVTVAPGAVSGNVFALCSGSKQVIGGGFSGSAGSLLVEESLPTDNHMGWIAYAYNSSPDRSSTFQSYAICANVAP